MSMNFSNIRLLNGETTQNVKPKQAEPPKKGNAPFSVWNTSIDDKPANYSKMGYNDKNFADNIIKNKEENAMNFLAKFLQATGFAPKNYDTEVSDNFGNLKTVKLDQLTDEQEQFMLDNQLENAVLTDKDGKELSTGVQKQKAPDENITNEELMKMIDLKNSLDKMDQSKLNEDEKKFLQGFDKTFGNKGTGGLKTYEGDFVSKTEVNVYQRVKNEELTPDQLRNRPALTPANPTNAKIVPIKNGETYWLMAETVVYDDPNSTLINTNEKLKLVENVKIEDPFTDVNDYVNRVPQEQAKYKGFKELLTPGFRPMDSYQKQNKLDTQEYYKKQIETIKASGEMTPKKAQTIAEMSINMGDYEGAINAYTTIAKDPNVPGKKKLEIQGKITELEILTLPRNASVNTNVLKVNNKTYVERYTNVETSMSSNKKDPNAIIVDKEDYKWRF